MPPFDYSMRINQAGTQLVQSKDIGLEPWLPSRQFGWLVTDDSILKRFFQPIEKNEVAVDFDRYFVLAMIRYDLYPWRFEVSEISWNPNKPEIQVAYTLVPVGRIHKDPLLSTQLILVEKTPEIQRLGITNLKFSLQETLDIADPDVAVFGHNPDELIFPTAYTLEEILGKEN
ncbi:MAG: hypothetical protein AB8H47_07070 [Bacteroidia bacterium]